MKSLEILLATYNGGKYLPEFLDSLLAQSDDDFVLRVRDDGSKDSTLEVLEGYRSAFSGRMILEADSEPSGSSNANFSRLMELTPADHILWADQDDVWLPEKVAVTRQLLRQGEAEGGSETPVYAYTDASPTDANLVPLHESYLRFKKTDPEQVTELRHCLVCPPMIGCASGINRRLLELARPVPADAAIGHDWWSFLIASAMGRILHTDQPMMLYRQHETNVSNQKRNSVASYVMIANKRDRVRRGMTRRWLQAKALRDRPPADVIFESLDTDHDGTLSRREFLSGMSHINSLAEGASNASLFSHR